MTAFLVMGALMGASPTVTAAGVSCGAQQMPNADVTPTVPCIEDRWWVTAWAGSSSDFVQGTIKASLPSCSSLSEGWHTTEFGAYGSGGFANAVIKATILPGAGCTYEAAAECKSEWIHSTKVALLQSDYTGSNGYSGVFFLVERLDHRLQSMGLGVVNGGPFQIWIWIGGQDPVVLGTCDIGNPIDAAFWSEGWDSTTPVYSSHQGSISNWGITGSGGPPSTASMSFNCDGIASGNPSFGYDNHDGWGNLYQGTGLSFDNAC